MEQLIKMVQEKVGVPEDKARLAVSVVMEQIKKVLPPQFASQLDTLLGQGGATEGSEQFAEVASGIKKLF